MDTIQLHLPPTRDDTLCIDEEMLDGIHIDMPDYEVSVYRNRRDEMLYRVDTRCYWPVSDKVKSKSFLNKSSDSALTRRRIK